MVLCYDVLGKNSHEEIVQYQQKYRKKASPEQLCPLKELSVMCSKYETKNEGLVLLEDDELFRDVQYFSVEKKKMQK